MPTYSERFRASMVNRMLGPKGISANALAAETGVTQGTLSRWLRVARSLSTMTSNDPTASPSKRSNKPRLTAEDKLAIVMEASSLEGEALGAFLRRNGLTSKQIDGWREKISSAAQDALTDGKRKKSEATPEQVRIRRLEKELLRKDRALAEVAALLALKKRAEEIWGDGDESTPKKSGS